MRKSLLIISVVLPLLFGVFQNCAGGTDTGNPATSSLSGVIGSDYPKHYLDVDICSVLIRCNAVSDEVACRTKINEMPGVAVLFGAAAPATRLTHLSVVGVDEAALASCKTDIQTLPCDGINLNDPFAHLDQVVPQSCATVFSGQ